MNKRQVFMGILLILLIWIVSPILAEAQCAMCNATAATATEGKKESALALNRGILFLMAIPYILLSSLVIIWWQFSKQKRAERAQAEAG